MYQRSDSDMFLMFYAFCNWDFTTPCSWLTHAAILMVCPTDSWLRRQYLRKHDLDLFIIDNTFCKQAIAFIYLIVVAFSRICCFLLWNNCKVVQPVGIYIEGYFSEF